MGISAQLNVDFSVQPNPSEGKFSLDFPVIVADLSLKLIDLSGKMLASQSLHGSKFELDFSNFNEGIYLLQITSLTETKMVRISIVK